MTQDSFVFTDPTLDKREKPRLSKQCAAILKRLERGPAANVDLAALALKYTSRISDLRRSGYKIVVTERDYGSGEVMYELKGDESTVMASMACAENDYYLAPLKAVTDELAEKVRERRDAKHWRDELDDEIEALSSEIDALERRLEAARETAK